MRASAEMACELCPIVKEFGNILEASGALNKVLD